jgi:iron complex outermembrane receptor protein
VVVTARKRDEKLLDVPIAITAFTSQSIQNEGIYSLSDLANFAPGLSYDDTVAGSGRSDRSFPEYVIRGMVPSLTTNPTTTVFVDGTPLISGQIDGLDDLERVEVLKGPQSAFFGRETFAGAINLITRDPSDTPLFSINALGGTRNYFDERASLEGPILGDSLTGRVSYRYYTQEGSYSNEAAADRGYSHLGDQSTQSVNFDLAGKVTSDLSFKVHGMYWHDDDGPSAQALIYPGQSNCDSGWFCGQVPGPVPGQPAANTVVTPQIAAFLAYAGKANGMPFNALTNHYGLVRDAYHGSASIDYYVPEWGVTFTSLTGLDNQRFTTLQDLTDDDESATPNFAYFLGLPYANSYNDFPFLVDDSYRGISEEFRIASDADQPFRWLVGVNYEWSRVDEGLAGGNFNYTSGQAPQIDANTAFFYGLNYDLFPNLTLTAEGRYAIDDESARSGSGASELTTKGTYHDYTPRFSVQYKFDPDVMAYATYSQGVNPGSFNSFIPTLPSSVQQELQTDYGAKVQVQPERLDNYEAGVKGKFFDDTLSLAADVYYDIWLDQINVQPLIYFVGPSVELTSADLNNGHSHLKGVEGDVNWNPIAHLELNASGAINDTDIVSGGCFNCSTRTGTTNVNGNQLPDVSKYQMALGAQYSDALTADWNWFARVDYSYKSRNYEDKDNLVYAPAQNLVNLRAGVAEGPLRIEAFVNNLTNERTPTSLSGFYDVGSPFETYAKQDALVANLPQLRTFGLRVNYKFGL